MPVDWRVEPLQKSHGREAFSCGHVALDRYLQQQARQDAQSQVAAVFVAVKPQDSTVLGFYSLSAASIDAADLPPDLVKKLPRYPHLPVTLLGRLAIDLPYKGQGLGQFLLLDALYRSLQAAAAIAAMAVVVDAKDAAAVAFYKRYGFMQLSASKGRMFLPMKTVAALFGFQSR
ncbi:MAG: GNAT family N-acetyltransferase [Burkholderiales bacterium PBB3]|nr:MAG: GNAT family N-acetyltransferase [Burkholderiales bacterium PBB3]